MKRLILIFAIIGTMLTSCKKEDMSTGYIIVTSREQINVSVPQSNPIYTLTVKNTGDKTAYNVDVKVSAIKDGIVIDVAHVCPIEDIAIGQSVTQSSVFINLSKEDALLCKFEDCDDIKWRNR